MQSLWNTKKYKAITHLNHIQQIFLSYCYCHHWIKAGFALLLKQTVYELMLKIKNVSIQSKW